MEHLQFIGRSHNLKSYERILMTFSGYVQKRVLEKVIRFWGVKERLFIYLLAWRMSVLSECLLVTSAKELIKSPAFIYLFIFLSVC